MSKTRKLTVMAMLTAIAVVLVYLVRFWIFHSAPYLEYEPADIPILIGAFAYGPLAGLLLTVAVSAIQAMTVSAKDGVYGFIMHVIATGVLTVTASVIYKKKHTKVGAALGLICGTVATGAVMMAANHFITPVFMGVPTETVDEMLLPVILPFNLIKAGGNSLLTFLLYKAVSVNFIKNEESLTQKHIK